jgi:hypothetical protein
MGAQGTTTIDFGAFPGKSDAKVTVLTPIIFTSIAEAWIWPVNTADHLADDHIFESIAVRACNIVDGVSFDIIGWNTSESSEGQGDPNTPGAPALGRGTRLWGQWTVAWVWN